MSKSVENQENRVSKSVENQENQVFRPQFIADVNGVETYRKPGNSV